MSTRHFYQPPPYTPMLPRALPPVRRSACGLAIYRHQAPADQVQTMFGNLWVTERASKVSCPECTSELERAGVVAGGQVPDELVERMLGQTRDEYLAAPR